MNALAKFKNDPIKIVDVGVLTEPDRAVARPRVSGYGVATLR